MTEQQPDPSPRLKPFPIPEPILEHKPIMYDGGHSALLSEQLLDESKAYREPDRG
jgi:hypothetical protein